MAKTALLIVDLQNDFLPGGALAVKEGDLIIPVINQLMELPFSCVIASKDWHPVDHGSFAKTHGKYVGDQIVLDGIAQILWPQHCVAESFGAEFPETLHLQKIEKTFLKGTNHNVDSYSAFFDNSRRNTTSLEQYLQEKGVTDLYVAGLTTDYCVKFTVLDALSLGYHTFVVLDACRAVNLDSKDEEKAIQEMAIAGAEIVFAKDFY